MAIDIKTGFVKQRHLLVKFWGDFFFYLAFLIYVNFTMQSSVLFYDQDPQPAKIVEKHKYGLILLICMSNLRFSMNLTPYKQLF